MSIVWLVPAALAGLALIAAPVLIHLLTRHERRDVPFPSLRFLHATRFSALRRRFVDDWPLLLLRAAIVAAAALALAGPLFITSARERAWSQRVSRAFVVAGEAPLPEDERRTAFATATFRLTEPAGDALAAAVDWLNRQPPSAREIVVAGDVRAGMIGDADLRVVPADVGVRFLLDAEAPAPRDLIVPLLGHGGESDALAVHLEDDGTRVSAASGNDVKPGKANSLSVRAAVDDQPVADAALRAVLAGGVVPDQDARRALVVAWDGADLSDLGAPVAPMTEDWIARAVERVALPAEQRGGVLVIHLAGRPVDAAAAVELDRVVRAVFADRRAALEPARPSPGDLARWSRPPAGVSDTQQPRDEQDRRWLWGLTLLLLVAEQLWRRRGVRRADEAPAEEARVA